MQAVQGYSDDRGQPVPLFDPDRMRGAPSLTHPEVAFAIRRAGAEFAGSGMYIGCLDGIVGLGLFIAFSLLRLSVGLTWLLVVAGLVVLGPRYRRWAPRFGARRRGERALAQMVRVGVCPACAYDLVGLAVAADGCIVCAECGGAWRADRITRTEPLGAAEELGWRTPDVQAFTQAASQSGVDSRARRVPLFYIKPRQILAWSWTGEERVRVLRGIEVAMHATRVERWAVAAILFAMSGGLFVPIGLLIRRIANDPGPVPRSAYLLASALLALPLAFAIGALWTLRGRSVLRFRAAPRAFATCGICPSCFSSLASGTVEEDRCTLCPGCGAAWRNAKAWVIGHESDGSAPREVHS